jgi:hypothetical protein
MTCDQYERFWDKPLNQAVSGHESGLPNTGRDFRFLQMYNNEKHRGASLNLCTYIVHTVQEADI